MKNDQKQSKIRATKHVVKQCQVILKRIDDYIPGTYSQECQRILSDLGIQRKISEIHDTRNGKLKDIVIMRVLEEMADVPNSVSGSIPSDHQLGRPDNL